MIVQKTFDCNQSVTTTAGPGAWNDALLPATVRTQLRVAARWRDMDGNFLVFGQDDEPT